MQEENKQIDPGTMERLVQGNEQIGYYRSISNYEEALKISKEMLELVKELGLQESEAHGTTLLNAATAYRAACLLYTSRKGTNFNSPQSGQAKKAPPKEGSPQ